MGEFFHTLKGRRVAFIGAGVSHKELIPMFAKAGALVTLCDAKSLEAFGPYARDLQKLGVNLCLGPDYLQGLEGQDMILRTPGFEFFTPELQAAGRAGAEITSEMELFFQYCPCPIVGITGSDGKTTTTSLIAAMYEAEGRRVHLGGNIGRALLPIVERIEATDVAVVELSSFQLISMRHSPKIAVVTNVTPNHLDHHKDMEEYIDAKRNLLAWQSKNSVAVLNMENPITRRMEKDVMGDCRWFSHLRKVDNGAYLSEEDMLMLNGPAGPVEVLPAGEILLRGRHNVYNMLAAFAALRDEVSVESMRQTARTFAGVEHRIEPVRTLDGVQWFNDSIASSPTRVIAGLRAFDQKLIVIAGGYDKHIPYDPMVPDVLERVKVLILLGQTANKIQGALHADPHFEASGLVILRAKDMEEAVALARQNAKPGDIVTLSPASASFDMYPNFEERGRHFKQLVNQL